MQQSQQPQTFEDILREAIQSQANFDTLLTLLLIQREIDSGYYGLEKIAGLKIWCDLDDDLPIKERDIHQAKRLIDHLQGHLALLARELDGIPTAA